MFHVYVVRNLTNCKQYVGVTNDPKRRWREHKTGHGSKVLRAAMLKYGLDNFTFEIIHRCVDEAEVFELEQSEIAVRGSQTPGGYNLSAGGEFAAYGMRHSAEAKAKMSVIAKQRDPISVPRGEAHHLYGNQHSAHTRRLISETAKQRDYTHRTGGNHPRAKCISFDGIEFPCIKDAAVALGITAGALRTRLYRLRNN